PMDWATALEVRTAEIKRIKDLQELADRRRNDLAEAQENQRQADAAAKEAEKTAQVLKDQRFNQRRDLVKRLFTMEFNGSAYIIHFFYPEIEPLLITTAVLMDATD